MPKSSLVIPVVPGEKKRKKKDTHLLINQKSGCPSSIPSSLFLYNERQDIRDFEK